MSNSFRSPCFFHVLSNVKCHKVSFLAVAERRVKENIGANESLNVASVVLSLLFSNVANMKHSQNKLKRSILLDPLHSSRSPCSKICKSALFCTRGPTVPAASLSTNWRHRIQGGTSMAPKFLFLSSESWEGVVLFVSHLKHNVRPCYAIYIKNCYNVMRELKWNYWRWLDIQKPLFSNFIS